MNEHSGYGSLKPLTWLVQGIQIKYLSFNY